MPQPPKLTLVFPRLLECLEDRSADHALPKDSILASLAGRGHLARQWHADSFDQARLQPWQRGLLKALGLDEQAHPSAGLTALGASIGGKSDWLQAEPIHLAAGMNEVTLVPLTPAAALTTQERDTLTAALQEHLTSDGFDLRPTAANEWLLGSERPFDVQTVCAEYAMRNEWSAVLPQGAGAGKVRRLMTELQMLLHDHPINEARAARGVPVVNALWLWGGGAVASTSNATRPCACHGDNDYLRGICKENGWSAPTTDLCVDAAIARANRDTDVVYVVTNATPLEVETHWLAPAVAALKRGDVSRLELVIDAWDLTIDRWQLRKFWRGALPAAAWARA